MRGTDYSDSPRPTQDVHYPMMVLLPMPLTPQGAAIQKEVEGKEKTDP